MATEYQEKFYRFQGLTNQLGKELEPVMAQFSELHDRALATGVMSKHIKELMALGIALALRCDNCIAERVHDALKNGATRGEILETIGVALYMGGAPTVLSAGQALEALEQF